MVRKTHGFRFGEFEVAPEAAELRRLDEIVHLEPKVLEVLVYLIEHRDRLVKKAELLEAVWTATFVTENALTKAIGRLRQALGDDAQNPRFIQTVHTLGYRFIAEAEERQASGSPAGAGTRPTDRPVVRKRLLPLGAILAMAAAALVLALNPGGFRDSWFGNGASPEIRSLAVLPLDNLTGDPELDYLVDAIHETLITELAQMSPLRVISRHSTLRYRDTDKAAPEIAVELAVDALVEGSVMRSGDRVRVSAQLILASEDKHLWAGSFDRNAGDLLVLLNDLAGAIGREIRIAITPERKVLLATRRPLSPEVEDTYFRARYFFGLGTSAGLREARALFTRTAELDPGFALAHAGLAGAHFLQGFFGQVPHRQAAAESERAALTALELAPDLAEAHGVLGLVRLYFDWDWPAAGRELKRAVELLPNDGTIRHGYGDYLLVMGRPEEALEQVRLGRRYDPASPLAVAPVVGHLLFLRRYDEVIDEARALLETDPGFPMVGDFLTSALWEQGKYDESLRLRREFWAARTPELADALERGRRESGPSGAMLAVAQLLATRADTERTDPVGVAMYFARGGDLDRAFEFLEKAVADREPRLLHVVANPAFDILRPDPRFANLLRRIGLPTIQEKGLEEGTVQHPSGPLAAPGQDGSGSGSASGAWDPSRA